MFLGSDYFRVEKFPVNNTTAIGSKRIKLNPKAPLPPFPPGSGVFVGEGTGVSVGGGSGVSVGVGSDVSVGGTSVSVGVGVFVGSAVLVGGVSVSVGMGVFVSVGSGVFVGMGVEEFVAVGVSVFVGTKVGVNVTVLVGFWNRPPPLTRVRRAKNGGTVGVGEPVPLAGVDEPPGVAEGPEIRMVKRESDVGVKNRLANACWVKARSRGVGVGD